MSQSAMSDQMIQRIQSNPKYQRLRSTRNRFAWILTIMMLVVYYGFVGLIAFDKELLATPLGAGVTTWGIPIGLGVIVFTVLITGVYVYRANTEFDAVTEQILKEASK